MFSLIVATFNRTVELNRLLDSLEQQTYQLFEVIIVDQNPDDRLLPIVQQHAGLQILHLRSEPGVSRARNVGLRAAGGDILSTPDDDCWYPHDLLLNVQQWFDAHPGCDALFTGLRNQDNHPMLPRWPPPAGPCTRDNALDCTAGATGFFRRKVIDAIGEYDESLGPGPETRFKACEDTDFCIRPLDFNFRMWYEPNLTVYHPELQSLDRLRRNNYPYALACGYIIRVHHYSWPFMAGRIARSLGGALLSLCKADLQRSYLYLMRAVGQFRGYAFGADQASKLAETSPR